MHRLFEPLTFPHGPTMSNRFMLAPLTNTQSHPDGRLSDEELRWLRMRAEGGFGLTMTCASHVQARGQGFPGQLGVFSELHEPGLGRLAEAIRAEGSLGVVQLHHAGMRSPRELIGEAPVCPSDNEKTGARALSLDEVEALVEAFIAAAERAQRCGFDGVEVHGAHGYVLAQFLSASINRRTDRYGGSLEGRSRIVHEILSGIRERCGEGFLLGLRLSPERFGQRLEEMRDLAQQVMDAGQLDFLDMSLWDVDKEPHEEAFQGRPLRATFLELRRGATRLGVAGKIGSVARARALVDEGFDFVSLGRAAILHHDFPRRAAADPGFEARSLPVSVAYLHGEGLSDTFVEYMRRWEGFVQEQG